MLKINICPRLDVDLVFALRKEVFVKEQGVPIEEEIDSEDDYATHFIAKYGDIVVGCARVIFFENDAHIGRLAIKKEFRGKGFGKAICLYIIDYCRKLNYNSIWLNSQLKAMEFYKKIGFKEVGGIFMDAGIEHKKMVL